MRPIKVLSVFIVLIAVLSGALYLFQDTLHSDLLSFFNEKDQTTEKNNVQVQGITLNSLNQPSLNGDIILYLNGVKEPQVINYRLSTGTQNILAKLIGSDLDYYAPGKVVVSDNLVYWIKSANGTSQLIRVDTKDVNRKNEVLYTNKNSWELVGVKIFSEDEIYLTEYTQEESDGFTYQIVRIKGTKAEVVSKSTGLKVKVVVGKDVNTSKGQLITQEYDDVTNKVSGNCYYLKNDQQVGCEKIVDLEYAIKTRQPTDQGYIMGENGFIQITDKKGAAKVILDGTKDEEFASATYKSGYVYFISGSIEPASSATAEDGNAYGSFQPVAIERIKIDGTGREKVKTLPSSLFADIDYISSSFIIVSLSQMSSDKLDMQPTNLWLLNLKNNEFKQITDIKCDSEEFCEAVMLAED